MPTSTIGLPIVNHDIVRAYLITDVTLGQQYYQDPMTYAGPVTGIEGQALFPTSDEINVDATSLNTGNQYIALIGNSMDSINMSQASGGNNILDGDYGSCFLTGSMQAAPDTFYVNANGALAGNNLWSTLVNFHAGDHLTIWDFPAQVYDMTWLNGQGAAGYTGLTGVFKTVEGPLAAVTFAGYTSADLKNGKLTISQGTNPQMSSSMGNSWYNVTAH